MSPSPLRSRFEMPIDSSLSLFSKSSMSFDSPKSDAAALRSKSSAISSLAAVTVCATDAILIPSTKHPNMINRLIALKF